MKDDGLQVGATAGIAGQPWKMRIWAEFDIATDGFDSRFGEFRAVEISVEKIVWKAGPMPVKC